MTKLARIVALLGAIIGADAAQGTTTEATSKKITAHMAYSIGLFAAGCIIAIASGSPTFGKLGLIMIFTGMAWYLVSGVRGWWHHG